MKKIIEENEFGVKRTDNRLCLVCKKYILKKEWRKHYMKCLSNPELFNKPPKCLSCGNLMEPIKEKDGSKSKHSFHCLKCYPNLIISIG